ncbi:MAG TPA: PDZ domain-containing protein [Trichormus sp.]|jgi:S1-C subfamily serine protease
MSDELRFNPSSDYSKPPAGYRRAVGVHLAAANPNAYNRFGMPPIAGPVVSRVIPDSPAHAVGVIEGDMILEVDGTPISALPGSSTDQVKTVIQHMNRSSAANVIVLRIRRNQEELIFKIAL